MRITGGKLAGRLVACPPGAIRPAMDRMRESVFSVLCSISSGSNGRGGNDEALTGKSFLDLFSGSGTIALEAASRGAMPVTLVESDKKKSATIVRNVEVAEKELGCRIECRFIAVELFLKRAKLQYDFIFLDPPFPYQFHSELLHTIAERDLLAPNGIALIHRPREKKLDDTIGSLQKNDTREYGRSIVDFYTHGGF
ncbi:MAG: 16S rRNA (guanine(966)-N(2))-methyltransferase RsmD [Treponemataceae bacterium]|nr:MAG: 16S rRNA (guanine(966)-N(2))-methyltransferase RsmD [Treponemataceae bacterium]